MDPKLISQREWVLKFFAIFFSIVLLLFSYELIGRGGSGLIFLALWPFWGYFIWYVFSVTHPVFFDDNYLYWGKEGKYSMPLENIEEITVKTSRHGRRARVNYIHENNRLQSIRFWVVESFSDDSYDSENVLKELQRQIRLKKPGFDIYI